MLSYRRETALQGALVSAKSVRLELGDNITAITPSIVNHCSYPTALGFANLPFFSSYWTPLVASAPSLTACIAQSPEDVSLRRRYT